MSLLTRTSRWLRASRSQSDIAKAPRARCPPSVSSGGWILTEYRGLFKPTLKSSAPKKDCRTSGWNPPSAASWQSQNRTASRCSSPVGGSADKTDSEPLRGGLCKFPVSATLLRIKRLSIVVQFREFRVRAGLKNDIADHIEFTESPPQLGGFCMSMQGCWFAYGHAYR